MDRSYFLTLLVAGVVVTALFYGAYYFETHTDLSRYAAGFTTAENEATAQAEASTSADIASVFDKTTPMTTPKGDLKIEDEKIGDGAEAKAGDSITVNY